MYVIGVGGLHLPLLRQMLIVSYFELRLHEFRAHRTEYFPIDWLQRSCIQELVYKLSCFFHFALAVYELSVA